MTTAPWENHGERSARSGNLQHLFRLGSYGFKLADRAEEFAQICRLLYETFVLEIGQHPDTGTGRHVDKFHHKNTYIVAVREAQLKGMLAVHDQPPFSVADAIACRDLLERLCPKLLEVRLLAVAREERGRQILAGFMWGVYQYAAAKGYQYLAISGLVERQRMYQLMGFRPLGGPVQRGKAMFVPMLLDLANLPERAQRNLKGLQRRLGNPCETRY